MPQAEAPGAVFALVAGEGFRHVSGGHEPRHLAGNGTPGTGESLLRQTLAMLAATIIVMGRSG